MLDDIKITILGTQGAGKTCYLLAMYGLMQMGFRGFSLQAKNFDMHIEINEKWDSLLDFNYWPLPTTGTTLYSFDFCYGLKPLLEIKIYDFPGDTLSKLSSDENVRKLIKNIKQTSCVFICISAEYLQLSSSSRTERNRAISRAIKCDRIHVYMAEMARMINPTMNNPFPIVFVITKFEQYSYQNNPQEVVDTIKELFPTFWYSPGWLISICPVSLGKELIKKPQTEQFIGEIDPVNVHVPVAFAIYHKFYESYLSKNLDYEKYLKLLSYEIMQSSFIYLNGQEGGFSI